MRKYILIVLSCLLLAGCNLDGFKPVHKQDTYQLQIQQVETKYKNDYDLKVKQLDADTKKKEDLQLDNLQQSAGLAYGIYYLNNIQTPPSRTDTIIGLKAKELITRLPPITPAAILSINDELKKELDEKQTTITDLQTKYQKALIDAQNEQKAKADAQAVIDQDKKNITDLKTTADQTVSKLKDAQIASEQKDLDTANKAKIDAENRAALIALLIKILVGIGAVTAIGAWAFKSLILAAASVGSFALSVYIAFVPPWMVITGGTLILVAIAGGLFYEWYKSYKAHASETSLSNSLVGSIEDIKSKVGLDTFNKDFAPLIQDWTKDVPGAEAAIQAKLKSLNLV